MRASLGIFIRDLKRLLSNPAALIVTLGVCAIPSAYAWLNVLANWNPYENTSTVSVAVVTLDEGADVPDVGNLNAGELVKEELEKNTQLGWVFLDNEQDALEGVRAGRYYAAFVIPADFTSSLASALDGSARQASIRYYVNEKQNAVAPKVTDTGATTLEDQIAEEFTRVAGEAVGEKVRDAAGSAADALDGTTQDALETVRGVERTLDSLANSLDAAQGDLSSARDALTGATAALDGISQGARSFSRSMSEALGSLDRTRGELRSYATELADALGDGSAALARLSSQASHDVGLVAGDVGWAEGKLEGAISQVESASQTIQSVSAALGRARDALASIPASGAQAEARDEAVRAIDEGMALLGELEDEQAAKLAELRETAQGLAAGTESARNLSSAVADAVQAGTSRLDELRASLAQDVSPQLTGALDALASSGGKLVGGADALVPMISQAQGTLRQLDAVLAQASTVLAQGASSLRDAASGARALADDLAAVQGASQTGVLPELLAIDPAEMGGALAAPVEMVDEAVFPVATYGSGVAPFYTNLALWVGGFVLVAVYKLEVDREDLALEASPAQAFWGRWMLLALLGQIQALVCCAGDLALGVQCVSPAAFVLAGMVASLVYVLVVYVLAATFKHVGKALAVLMVVLQIPGASGLYPIQMQPAFFQALGPWLPFTYGINAMREAVAGFYGANYAHDLLALLAFAAPAIAVAVALRPRLLGPDAFFDRQLGASGLLISERTGERAPRRLGALLDVLATTPEGRSALAARAERFEQRYPARVRHALVSLVVVPLCALALSLALPAARLALLALWVASLALTCLYLVGLAYARDRLEGRKSLSDLGKDELVRLALGEKDGDDR